VLQGAHVNQGLPAKLQLNEYRRAKLLEVRTMDLSMKAWKWLKAFYPKQKKVELPLWELIMLRRVFLFAGVAVGATDHSAVRSLETRTEGPEEGSEVGGALQQNFVLAFVGSDRYRELQDSFRDGFGQLPPPRVVDTDR